MKHIKQSIQLQISFFSYLIIRNMLWKFLYELLEVIHRSADAKFGNFVHVVERVVLMDFYSLTL